MKKKKMIPLLALLAAAAVLVALYLALSLKEKEEPQPSGEEAVFFQVKAIAVESVDRIEISNASFSGSFVRDGEVWRYGGSDEFFPVRQKTIENLISILLSNLNAFQVLEDPAELSEYGLAEPVAELTAYAGEQELVGISLGNALPTKEQYYCMFSGDPKVYTVSVNYQRFLTTAREDFLAELELPSVAEISQLQEIELTGALGSFHAVRDAANPYDYSGKAVFDWYFSEPYARPVNADYDAWYQQCAYYLSFSYESLAAYMPQDVSVYGLSEPTARLTVVYTSQSGNERSSYTLELGSEDENGNYYARLAGSDWIMTISPKTAENRFSGNVYPWVCKTIVWPGTHGIASLSFAFDGEEHTLAIALDESGDGSGEAVGAWDGETLSQERFFSIQSDLLSLRISASAEHDAVGEEAVLTIRVEVRDTETMRGQTVEFLPYNEEAYAVCVDGTVDFLVDKRDLTLYLEQLRSY